MDRRTTRTFLKAALGLSGALAVLVLSASPAAAQIPEPGDLIEDVTNAVDDIATETGDGAADVVENVTGNVGNAVGGEVGQTTQDVGTTVGSTVRDVTGDAGDAIGGTGSTIDDVVDGVTGGSEDPAPGANGEAPNVGGDARDGRVDDGSSSRAGRDGSSATTTDTDLAPVGTLPATNLIRDNGTVFTGAGEPSGGGLIDALGGIAFPLVLIAIVAAYLAIQGRVDADDPKLSLSLLDPEDDMLSFR